MDECFTVVWFLNMKSSLMRSESLLTDACKRVSPFYKEIGTINGGFAQVLFGCPSYGAMNLFFHGCQALSFMQATVFTFQKKTYY